MHGQSGEDVTVLGYVTNPQLRDLEGAVPQDLFAAKAYGTRSLDHPENSLCHGGAPHAVAPKQGDDLALVHMHVDALENVALAVVGVQALHVQHALRHQCAPSGEFSSSVVPR